MKFFRRRQKLEVGAKNGTYNDTCTGITFIRFWGIELTQKRVKKNDFFFIKESQRQ